MVERKFTFWVVYDATDNRHFVKMDSETGCLTIFDSEEHAAAFASGLDGVGYKEVVLYSQPSEVVGWQFYQDGKWWNGDDRIKGHKKNTQEAGFRIRDVYAISDGPTIVKECTAAELVKAPEDYRQEGGES